jgi:hypothetical protein
MVSGNMRTYLRELNIGVEIQKDWKYLLWVVFVVLIMVSVLVFMLPDRPFEFW